MRIARRDGLYQRVLVCRIGEAERGQVAEIFARRLVYDNYRNVRYSRQSDGLIDLRF